MICNIYTKSLAVDTLSESERDHVGVPTFESAYNIVVEQAQGTRYGLRV